MSVISMIKTIKRVHDKEVVLVKIGEFYHAYGKDACVLSYLFEYKLKLVEGNYTCGFPVKSVAKIQAELERNLINYVLLDRRNNYEVDEYCNNKELNKYDDIWKKAYLYVKRKEKIDNIYNCLLMNIYNDELEEKLSNIAGIINAD